MMREQSLKNETKGVAEFQRAKDMMSEGEYSVGDNVRVVVDSNLGFMGYAFPNAGKFTIVASDSAVGSGMLEGLLVHEMSHIYRIQTKHPSHSDPRVGGVIRLV